MKDGKEEQRGQNEGSQRASGRGPWREGPCEKAQSRPKNNENLAAAGRGRGERHSCSPHDRFEEGGESEQFSGNLRGSSLKAGISENVPLGLYICRYDICTLEANVKIR